MRKFYKLPRMLTHTAASKLCWKSQFTNLSVVWVWARLCCLRCDDAVSDDCRQKCDTRLGTGDTEDAARRERGCRGWPRRTGWAEDCSPEPESDVLSGLSPARKSPVRKSLDFPWKVKSGLFRPKTGLKQDPEMAKKRQIIASNTAYLRVRVHPTDSKLIWLQFILSPGSICTLLHNYHSFFKLYYVVI